MLVSYGVCEHFHVKTTTTYLQQLK